MVVRSEVSKVVTIKKAALLIYIYIHPGNGGDKFLCNIGS
jgi:hypothetical protein